MLIRRSSLALLVAASIVSLTTADGLAQTFKLDLDRYHSLQAESPWDTLRTPIDRLYLGPNYAVPNFLPSDFARERVIEEFAPATGLRFEYRVPPTEAFRSEESRDGVFITMSERPVDAPGVSVSVATLDEIAEERRIRTLHEEWTKSVVKTISGQDVVAEEKKGLLNISIPVSLPGPVEKIIGQGEKTNIDISGRESITFAGETRRVSPFYGVEGLQKQPLFPSLDMKQELDVRLQGRIGEKINIQVDHSSSTALEGQNRIRLNYQGFDDDVVKLIELGNTSLSLPGSQLVSFSAASKGLFGVKTLAQAGPVDVTAIASKEEGEVSRASFSPSGGQIGQMERREIRDTDFIKNRYFFLDNPFDPARFSPPQVGKIDLFRSVPTNLAQTTPGTWGAAYVDTVGDGSTIGQGAVFEKSWFEKLEQYTDYNYVLNADNPNEVIGIELSGAVGAGQILAVAYINGRNQTIGDYAAPYSSDETSPLVFELIWPAAPNPQGPFGYTWNYMMRNIYDLTLSDIDRTSLQVEITDNGNRANPTTPDSSSVPWIRIFGLDQTDIQGTGLPDSKIDLTSGLINFERGLITFPVLTPFDPPAEDVQRWTSGQFAFEGKYKDAKNPNLYTQRPEDGINFLPKFSIVVNASSTTKTFKINAFNITEGSEVVKVDGQTLQRNRDYTIDYETGELEFIGDIQLTASSNITVDYEYKPFLGVASSTLMGFNAIWNLSTNSRVGTTWLYESKASSTDKPRLGEEPTKSVIGGLDLNLQYEPDFLTSLVNLLPLVDTDSRSSFGVNGGMAMSFPDPNTKGEAYVDDMEGVEDSDVLSLVRRSWYAASPPVDLSNHSLTLPADKRAKIYWYNIEPDRGVHRRDLNPELDERESSLVPSLDIEFDAIPADSTEWAGVMTGFRGGVDLSQAQFLELWVNDFQTAQSNRKGILHIDLGYIDEDFYRPDADEWNREDKDGLGFTIGGDQNEDTGLDGIPTGQEGDDPDDDYNSQRIPTEGNRFTHIDGTEANGLPDSEDLDGSGLMETRNGYFTFTVDLSDSAVTDIRRDFPSFNDFTDSLDSWRFYRIDLTKFEEVRTIVSPLIEQVKHARIWLTDVGDAVSPRRKRIEIADLKVVGNRWEKDGVRTLADILLATPGTPGIGPRFALGVISNKTDPATYRPPINPNVQNEITEKEQSLLVKYDDIDPETGLRVLKRFSGSGLDFSLYRDLNFFVHTDKLDPDLEYFFRLAFDSLAFYEVRIPLTSEFFGSDNWCRVAISLNDLTGLKLAAPDPAGGVTGTARDLAEPGKVYTVRLEGLPTLFNVRFVFAGLRNRSSTRSVSGELWINDIYLGNRSKDVDTAERLTASMSMGNVINLSGSWSRTGPDYVPFGQKRASGTSSIGMSLNGKTNVEDFVPLFGFNIPITGSYSRNTNLPKYMPNSDTQIGGTAIQDSMKTESTTEGVSATLTRAGSKNVLLKYTFDKLRLNYNISQSKHKDPASADTTTAMSGTADYSISFSGKHRLRLFKNFGIRYWPNSLNYRVTANKTEGQHYRNVGGDFVPDPFAWAAGLTNFGSINYVPVPSLNTNFRIQTQRDLKMPHEWMGVDLGTEIGRSHGLQMSYKPPPIVLLRLFSPDFSYTSTYTEDSSPNIRIETDPPGTVRNVNSARDVGVKIGFDLGKHLGKLFGTVGLLEGGKGDEKSETGDRPPPGGGAPPRGTDSGANPQEAGKTGKSGEQPAAGDSVQAKPKPHADPLTAVKKIAGMLSRIRKINASVQQRSQSAYSRIPGRPTLLYQFGLSTTSGVATADSAYDEPEGRSSDVKVVMDSGVQLTKNIDVAARVGRSTGTRTFRGSESHNLGFQWPDLSLSWKELEKIGPFRGLFETASATVTYNKSTQKSGRSGFTDVSKETMNLTPSIVFVWKNEIQSSVGVQYAKDKTDSRGSINENSNLGVNLDLKYSFTPGNAIKIPLPFLRNKTLKSRLDTSMSAGYTRQGGRRSSGEPGRFVSVPGQSTIRFSPRVAYNFTAALNGSFFIDYSRTHADASDQTTTIVRLGLTATFTF